MTCCHQVSRIAVRATAAWALLAVLILLVTAPHHARAQSRVALIIGNSAYAHVTALPNPANDAEDVAASFERLGFQVTRVANANRAAMLDALRSFEERSVGAEIAIVFFAGHGIEVDGTNYLIPVDARLARDVHVEDEAIALGRVMRSVESARKLRLVLLDACRDNPFRAQMTRSASTRSIGRGLARIEPPGSTLVAYAAKEQTVAEDGRGRNSPFTQALLRHVETPGLEINFVFRAIRDDVMDLTNRRQEPFVYGSLARDPIYLKEGSAVAPPAVSPPPPVATDEFVWKAVNPASAAQLQNFIDRFPESARRQEAERLLREMALAQAAPAPSQRLTGTPRPSMLGACFEFGGQRYCR
jgi:uncharacterized caspase-like protein